MERRSFSVKIHLLFFLGGWVFAFSQPDLNYHVNTIKEQCNKGAASLHIPVPGQADSVLISWSTGERNVIHINSLNGGDYWVQVRTRYKKDTLDVVNDTILYFTVVKEQCPLLAVKYFSPNDDGYNDFFSIGNIDKYPHFELSIYNKWGQRVHHQKKEYVPWDGKWLGADLPDGVYYYVIFLDAFDKNKFVKGDVTILR